MVKKSAYVFILVVFALAVLVARNLRQEAQFQKIPESVVPFFVQNSNGDSVSFDSQKGKWTLIVLSASWCPACHAQNKALKKVYREEHQNGFRIFMISEDDALANVRKYKEDFEFPWDVYHWNYNAMNALGNPQFIPVSYLVNKQNKIVWIKSGTLKYDELKKELKAQQEQP